jgi:hypothetical protein
MLSKTPTTALSMLRSAVARTQMHARALFARGTQPDHVRLLRGCGRPRWRKYAAAAASVVAFVFLCVGLLWWRLGMGPMALDMATPWLTAALEEKLGHGHQVEVGGTVLERDESGRAALRLRDIVVRDTSGAVVASAPKAEVGIAGTSLLTGHLRAERLSLIGAEMAVRIEPDGQLAIFTSAASDTAVARVIVPGGPPRAMAPASAAGSPRKVEAATGEPSLFTAVTGWLQSLDAGGLDGRDLAEVGLKSGSLVVDDRRSGKQLRFENINLSVTRLKPGGVALAVSSESVDGPWSLNAAVTPRSDGGRSIEAVIRDVSPKDVMLALRIGNGEMQADLPLSAVFRADIGADGMPQMLESRIMGGAGYVGNPNDKSSRILIDEVQARLQWDPEQRVINMPFELHSGPTRISVIGQFVAPQESGGVWGVHITQGSALLTSLARPNEPPLMLDRIAMRGAYDPATKRFDLGQVDIRGPNGGVSMAGSLDCGGAEPRLKLSVNGGRMAVAALKRLWPVFITPELRDWVDSNVLAGTVERMVITTNTPLALLLPNTPPMPEDGLAIEIAARGATVRLAEGLPPARDADILTRVVGRKATVTFGRGTVDLPSGKRLSVLGGVFEVADTSPKAPLSRSQVRIEGALDAVGELLGMEPLRESGSVPFDTASTRGNVSAQIWLGMPLGKTLSRASIRYDLQADIAGFAADQFLKGQKAEAAMLKVLATQDLLQIRGDMRISGSPAVVDYRKASNAAEADVSIHATLDDAARSRLGLELGNTLFGPVPVKMTGRMKKTDKESESRFKVEADLTQARVVDLVPGWSKPPGRIARTSFVMIDKGQTIRLEEFRLDGGGAAIRGQLEVDAQGDVVFADLPSFGISDGDKASLKVERSGDGTLKLSLRGDVFDGRGLVKSSVSGNKPDQKAQRSPDIDVDIKVGAMTGHHGEALRNLEMRMSRRNGQIRAFSMNGRLGRDARIVGSMRSRGAGQAIHLKADDAGALFRFTDIYPRIIGGIVEIGMEPPTVDNTPKEGLLNIHDFVVRGERALEQVAATSVDPNDQSGNVRRPQSGVAFSRLRAEFTRAPGRIVIRDGLVMGPSIGATVEGNMDYGRDEVRMRGTFVPAYALNNMFAQVPILGFFLGGGQNEGLLGVTYQVVGSPAAPVLQVNPMSAVAPGFLRKLFEFRDFSDERTGRIPDQTR